MIAAEDQQKGLVAIADKAKFHKTTRNFLGLLAQNGRARDLTGVIAGLRRCMPRRPASSPPRSSRPRPLTAAQTKSIQTALRTALGKDAEMTARVDPSILGGLKVKVGSKLFDASLKTKLDQMKFALKRA